MATLEKVKKEKKQKKSTTLRLNKQTNDCNDTTSGNKTIVETTSDINVNEFKTFEGVPENHGTSDLSDSIVCKNLNEADKTSIVASCIDGEEGNELSDSQVVNETFTIHNEPIAPLAKINKTIPMEFNNLTLPIVQYPNLVMYEHVEPDSKIMFERRLQSSGVVPAQSDIKSNTVQHLPNIFYCSDLELAMQFETQFLMNSAIENYENDSLYAALLDYYHLQNKLSINMLEVKNNVEFAIESQKNIWCQEEISKTFNGLCGDSNMVYVTVKYDIIKVRNSNLETSTKALTELYNTVCHTYTNNYITANIVKAKIDQIVNELLTNSNVPETNILLRTNLDTGLKQTLMKLRRAISILFIFVRKVSPNLQFDEGIKKWLTQIISLYVLIATKEDHWFLLLNILRCPNGFASWATSFFQIPMNNSTLNTTPLPLQLNSPEMNHCIAVLHIILHPIKKRNDYLTAFSRKREENSDFANKDCWILLDSDGEDTHTPTGEYSSIKESDLIALLNQIPFEKVFSSALNVEKICGDYIIEPDLITMQQMLDVIGFFVKVTEILGDGLITYNIERYKIFAKRLARLVHHALQYAVDYYELFMRNNLFKDDKMINRINVELNALVVKACSYIYRSRNLATWQYFAVVPFYALDTNAIWYIFYYLNVGFPEKFLAEQDDPIKRLNAPDFWSEFNSINADVSAEDLYYLLQTFTGMTSKRDTLKDWELIETICIHIFNIGFINPLTRDTCYKTARDMLLNITTTYVDLVSCLLKQLNTRFNEAENAFYLFKSLPLKKWKPGSDCFEILSYWLLNYDFKSQENIYARLIISHLNWGLDSDGRMFFPHNTHVYIACLIVDALTRHAPEVIGFSGISESVRQVSNLVDFTQSTKDHFTNWCWSMISILRCHLMDQSVDTIRHALQNPTEPLSYVPDLENIDLIYKNVKENRPIAIYVGILITLHGHSVPLICQKGFNFMKLLLTDHRHIFVIRCLELIVPLFLDTPDTLANCAAFQSILNILLKSDETYLKMAKGILCPNAVGPVLEMFDNMLHHQILSYTNYSLHTPKNLINIWMNCFTSLGNWQHQYNVLYLLDKLLHIAYQFPDCRAHTVDFFCNYFKDCDDWKDINNYPSFKSLFVTAQALRVPKITANQCWLALGLLETEFRIKDSIIWAEIQRRMTLTDCRENVDLVLKETCSIIQIRPFDPSMLVINKYANLILNVDISHPVFIIITQKFFELYLWRFPDNYYRPGNVHGFSKRFFEYNLALMKKIQMKLKNAEVQYDNQARKNADDEVMRCYYWKCRELMRNYGYWLDETNINNICSWYEELNNTVNEDTSHWIQCIYSNVLCNEQRKRFEQWGCKKFRIYPQKKVQDFMHVKRKITPVQRIKTYLASYDKFLEAPIYQKPKLEMYKEITVTSLECLKKKLDVINNTATKFHCMTKELNSLNCTYLDIILKLYSMVPYDELRSQSCRSFMLNRECTNPARIKVTIEHICKNDGIEEQINTNRELCEKVVNEFLSWNIDDFAEAISVLKETTRKLIEIRTQDLCLKTGIDFFYYIVDSMTDITMQFSPAFDLHSQLLYELGVFIQEENATHGLAILHLALKRPHLLKTLTDAFVPYRIPSQHFLEIYKFLIESHFKRNDDNFLLMVFSKFELICWLETQHTTLHDINLLLSFVVQGLESSSQKSSNLLQDKFRQHLVHIFSYNFPQNCDKVLQSVLNSVSEQKVMPEILIDLLNSLLIRSDCETFNFESTDVYISAVEFARCQKLLNLKSANDTVILFAQHFKKVRLCDGSKELYSKHRNYCRALAVWFVYLGYVFVASATYTHQKLMADQLSEFIFGSIIEMYSPWLIPYTRKTMPEITSNYINKLTQRDLLLLPWSKQNVCNSELIIASFIETIKYILEHLPTSNKVLDYTFSWYAHHFAISNMEKHILAPVHKGILQLPWEHFQPKPPDIDLLFDRLDKCTHESYATLGHIFIQIDWNVWFNDKLFVTPSVTQTQTISRLFTIFIKIAFEPNIYSQTNTTGILEAALHYPWCYVEYDELQNLLKWTENHMDPTIVLQLPSKNENAGLAIIELFRVTCAMKPKRATVQHISNATGKRILYIRFVLHLQQSFAGKNKKLLVTKDGQCMLTTAFTSFLNTISLSIVASNRTVVEQQREALTIMVEIVKAMESQDEEISNLQIKALIEWQHGSSNTDNLRCSIIPAIAHVNTFTGAIYELLETSIEEYFLQSEAIGEWRLPSWRNLATALKISLCKLELRTLVNGQYFLTMHVFILYKLEKFDKVGDKITFLLDLTQLIKSLKISPAAEPCFALVWGLIISRFSKLLAASELLKNHLLLLARRLQIANAQAEGWSDGLLGVIGLKKNIPSNRYKLLMQYMACVIFSLFPNCVTEGISIPSEEFECCLREISALLSNKKFNEMTHLIEKVVSILKERKISVAHEVPKLIFRVFDEFYDMSYITTIPEIWDVDFKLYN